MWMQTVNREDTERVWVNITNVEGATMTAHWPVFKILSSGNAASVAVNQGAVSFAKAGILAATNLPGALVGLAYEDIANGDVGAVQVFGYHESALIANDGAALSTIRPGQAIGPMSATSVTLGLNSVGYLIGIFGPVVALDTITAVMMSAAGGRTYADHVYLRCL